MPHADPDDCFAVGLALRTTVAVERTANGLDSEWLPGHDRYVGVRSQL